MSTAPTAQIENAHRQFVEMMPDIHKIAGRAFDWLDPEAREEAVAETVALCWKNYLHCVSEEKSVGASSLAYYAILGVKSGRSMCGQSSTDILAKRTRLLGRAKVESLDVIAASHDSCPGSYGWGQRCDALVDRRVWERPLERVRIRHDYGLFLTSEGLTQQERDVFNLLTLGNQTKEIAEELHVSAPRVCQVKDSLARKLKDFMGPRVYPAAWSTTALAPHRR